MNLLQLITHTKDNVLLGFSLLSEILQWNIITCNLTGGGEQTAEVINGEVNGAEVKEDTTVSTEEPKNGVLQEDAGELWSYWVN